MPYPYRLRTVPAAPAHTEDGGFKRTVKLRLGEGTTTGRQWFGPVYVSDNETGELVVDKHGEVVNPVELEAAVYKYMKHHRGSSVLHGRRGVAQLIECAILTREKRAALNLPVGPTIWWVGMEVSDEATLKALEARELRELSFGGWSKSRPLEGSPGVTELYDLEIEEVGFVDEGAGQGVALFLRKRARSNLNMKNLSPTVKRALAALSNAQRTPIEAALAKVTKAEGDVMTLQDVLDALDETQAGIVLAAIEMAGAAPAAAPAEPVANVAPEAPAAPAAPAKDPEDPEEAPAVKALRKRLKEKDAEHEALAARLAELEAGRTRDEVRAVAKGLRFIPGLTEDMAVEGLAVIRRVEKRSQADGVALRELEMALERANKALEQSDLLNAKGHTRETEDSSSKPAERVMKAARDIASKEQVTFAEALRKVAKSAEHAKDYAAYRAGR